ncbi:hypothetical protein SEVIR_2G415966v4 [Setaria viridis]
MESIQINPMHVGRAYRCVDVPMESSEIRTVASFLQWKKEESRGISDFHLGAQQAGFIHDAVDAQVVEVEPPPRRCFACAPITVAAATHSPLHQAIPAAPIPELAAQPWLLPAPCTIFKSNRHLRASPVEIRGTGHERGNGIPHGVVLQRGAADL